jgi:hypothetical protein
MRSDSREQITIARARLGDRVLGILEHERRGAGPHPPGGQRDPDPVGGRGVPVAEHRLALREAAGPLGVLVGQRGEEPPGQVHVRGDAAAVADRERGDPVEELADQGRLAEAGRSDQRDVRTRSAPVGGVGGSVVSMSACS